MADTESSVNLTARDTTLIALAFANGSGELTVDFEAFAKAAGLKNAASARTAWHGVRKKLEQARPGPAVDSPKTKRKPKSTESQKDGNADDAEESSPSKKTKKSPVKGKKASANVEEGIALPSKSPAKKTATANSKKAAVKNEQDANDAQEDMED